ncbi:MAG: 5-formyltetrahydrofolate cyclo-ligase [Cyanobacteriota bacterium]
MVSFPSDPGQRSNPDQPSRLHPPGNTAPLSTPEPPPLLPATPFPSPPADTKTALRRHFRQRRRQVLPAVLADLIAAAAHRLPSHLAPSSRLGLYWPVGHEPDLRPLPDQLPPPWREHLALPAIRDDRLLYLPWRPGDPLAPDQVGIPAPTVAPPLEAAEVGLLLVPALAVDHSGLRLGSGGGWYDRLRSDPLWAAVPALVVVPDACVVPRLPSDPWDVPFPGRLTETGLHWSDARTDPTARVATS